MLTFAQFLAEASIKEPVLFNSGKNGRMKELKGKIGQSGKRDFGGKHTVLWYKHPKMGLRVIDHPGTNSPITHAEWMHQEGVKNHEYDRLPRGRFHIMANTGKKSNEPSENVHEFLHSGKETPDDVYRHVAKNYKMKFFTPNHHIFKQT